MSLATEARLGLDFAPAASVPVIEPRPYQLEDAEAVFTAWDDGYRRVLYVAATGLGKTVGFSYIAREWHAEHGDRVLILAHRGELLDQAATKLRLVWPGADVGIVQAGRDARDAEVVIASVQTLAIPRRLDAVLARGDFGLVIVDEAHHVTADTYRRILDRVGSFHADGPLTLGVTATPKRGDGVGLGDVFETVAAERTIRWGIQHGYLCDLRAVRVRVRVDWSAVKRSRGDFQDGALGKALLDADAPGQIVDAWEAHAAGRPTIAFTPTVAMAVAVADEYGRRGHRAAWVSGDTPNDARREILAAYGDGRLDVVANCGVLTEGFDEPRTACIIPRPTGVQSLYVQMVGRGTRKHPDKRDCLVLDPYGVSTRLRLVTAADLFGLPDDKADEAEQRGMTLGEMAHELDEAEAEPLPDLDADDTPRERAEIVAEQVDLWDGFDDAAMAWVQGRSGAYGLLLGERGVLVLRPYADGWRIVYAWRDQSTGEVHRQTWPEPMPLEVAQGVAEDHARRLAEDAAARAWRSRPATPRQLRQLARRGVPACEAMKMTAGEAHDYLSRR